MYFFCFPAIVSSSSCYSCCIQLRCQITIPDQLQQRFDFWQAQWIWLRDILHFVQPVPQELNVRTAWRRDNLLQVDSVDVSFDSGNWGDRKFSIDDIKLNNVPAEYDVRVDSQAIRDVRFVGLVDYLNNLDVADITATSDLSNVSVKEGKQLVPVSIGIINKDGVWAVGEYKCSINKKKK